MIAPKYPKISDSPNVQAFYEKMRERGESHSMAEICAMRSAPGIETDSTMLAGIGTLDKQFEGDEEGLNIRVAVARQHGYEPSPNDFYCKTMARFPGDPEGFISQAGGKSQIRKTLEKRGIRVTEGPVKTQGRQDEPKFTPLADSLIREAAPGVIAADPKLLKQGPRAIREAVIATHGPQS